MVYILPDTTGEEATATEDKSNIMSALSMRGVFPHTPYRLMLLDGNSRTQALDAGVRAYRCFSVDEFRGAMLWESCRCPGWSAILSNLLTNVAAQELKFSRSCWWGLYARGLDLEIYGFLARQTFHGLSIIEFACIRNGICIVTAVGERGEVLMLPCTGKVQGNMVLFAICSNRLDLHDLQEDSDRNWMDVLRVAQELHHVDVLAARERSYIKHSLSDGKTAREDPPHKTINGHPPAHCFWASWGRMAVCKSPPRTSSVVRTPPPFLEGTGKTSQRVLVYIFRGVEEIGQSEFVRGFSKVPQTALNKLTANVVTIREAADTTPFVLVVSLAISWRRRSWRHFGKFFQKLRQDFPKGSLPVVILCRSLPDDDLFFDALGLSQDSADSIGICVGEPTTAKDLARSGAQECAAIVVSSTSVLEDLTQKKAHEMRDADAVLFYRVLQGMGQSH
ncbi:unnamed protein product, partial [Prorocentrum cordatum]